MANCNDLPNKMKQLVVEEKTNEKNWNDLPFEMKEIVVKEMDIKTRARLKMCSKSDKYLVESVPISYDELSIKIEGFRGELSVLLNITSKSKAILNVSMNANRKRHVLRVGNKQISCSSDEKRETMMKQVIASVLSTGKLRFECFYIENSVFSPVLLINSEFTIRAKQVNVETNQKEMKGWLNDVAPGVESIEIKTLNNSKGLGTIPAIMNAPKLTIKDRSDINDEQLISFNCTYMKHNRKSKITGKGLNVLIKKAILYDYPIGTFFNIEMPENSQIWEEINDGLDMSEGYLLGDYFEHQQGRINMDGNKQVVITIADTKFNLKIVSR